MVQKNVIAKIAYTGFHPRLGDGQSVPQNLVLKFGTVSTFENDGDYDNSKHQTIEKDFFYDPPINEQDWYWNSSTTTFQKTQP